MFACDLLKNEQDEMKPAGGIPPNNDWFGKTHRFCDSHNDCLIAQLNDKFSRSATNQVAISEATGP